MPRDDRIVHEKISILSCHFNWNQSKSVEMSGIVCVSFKSYFFPLRRFLIVGCCFFYRVGLCVFLLVVITFGCSNLSIGVLAQARARILVAWH